MKAAFGFVPNLFSGIIEENPAVAMSILAGTGAHDGNPLSPAEQQAVMVAVSAYNECHYRSAAHRTAGKAMGIRSPTSRRSTSSGSWSIRACVPSPRPPGASIEAGLDHGRRLEGARPVHRPDLRDRREHRHQDHDQLHQPHPGDGGRRALQGSAEARDPQGGLTPPPGRRSGNRPWNARKTRRATKGSPALEV